MSVSVKSKGFHGEKIIRLLTQNVLFVKEISSLLIILNADILYQNMMVVKQNYRI